MLGNKFIEEFKLENASLLDKAIACSILEQVVYSNEEFSDYMRDDQRYYYPEELWSESVIMDFLTEYGDELCDDLMYMLQHRLEIKGIQSPISFDSIFEFLRK